LEESPDEAAEDDEQDQSHAYALANRTSGFGFSVEFGGRGVGLREAAFLGIRLDFLDVRFDFAGLLVALFGVRFKGFEDDLVEADVDMNYLRGGIEGTPGELAGIRSW
jgi:hypothetical protein